MLWGSETLAAWLELATELGPRGSPFSDDEDPVDSGGANGCVSACGAGVETGNGGILPRAITGEGFCTRGCGQNIIAAKAAAITAIRTIKNHNHADPVSLPKSCERFKATPSSRYGAGLMDERMLRGDD